MMGAFMVFGVIAVPCALFLLYCLTPGGKRWHRENHMI